MSHQRRKVLEHPPSKTPRAKDWNNSEMKVEQLMRRILHHGYPSKYGAGFCEPEGWRRAWSRFLLSSSSSFWWVEEKPKNRPAQRNNSGWLMVGTHQRSVSHQATWRNQSCTGHKWQQHEAMAYCWIPSYCWGQILPHRLSPTWGTGGAWKGRRVTASQKTNSKTTSVTCVFLIFQLLELKTWTSSWKYTHLKNQI